MQSSLGNVSCQNADARFYVLRSDSGTGQVPTLEGVRKSTVQATVLELIDTARADLASEALEWDLSMHGSRDRR